MKKYFVWACSLFVVSLTSCDKDFNAVGSDILDPNVYEYNSYTDASIIVTPKETKAVETSNLPINTIGVFKHPVFGEIDNSFVTQVELTEENPTFGINPKIENVTLSIPYSRTLQTSGEYECQIYGADTESIDLKIYESGYFIDDLSSDRLSQNRIYSDQEYKISNKKLGDPLNQSSVPAQNKAFVPSKSIIDTVDFVTSQKVQLTPRLFIDLNKDFFQNKIFKASKEKLFNNNVFKDYFRGLFFKTSLTSAGSGRLMNLDFSKGQILINYKVNASATDTVTKVKKQMILKLAGNTAAFFNTVTAPSFENRMVLKGGYGRVAQIELFKGQIDELRAKKWLINEANLTFYVDEDKMEGSVGVEPKRIYIYNIETGAVVADYITDVTTSFNTKENKSIFDGRAQLNTSSRVTKYKVRITKQVNDIINSESLDNNITSLKLGVALTDDITVFSAHKNALQEFYVPVSSVFSPFGTILYNENPNNGDKKLKLEIFYSTTKQ